MTTIERGSQLWQKAIRIIPGGTQLLSKRAEMFLPDRWPSYYAKGKGVEIWDLDGNRFIDMSIMGVGACVLGYADDDVNLAVRQAVDNGSMTTLNCPEEVDLAELLLSFHHWADMVRYAKTGGEAMAIAVRIARAYSGKDSVAFCGYHGWHDWYLASNLAENTNLDGHLLPGLSPKGVPRSLKGTSHPFNYNNLEELERLTREYEIGVIVLEPIRHHAPENNFLEGVREIANEIDAVLIFDEITSGWRMNVGGIHTLYNVFPDIVVYGKAMSNGYPMSAIIGTKEVMEAAQDTFISSTYWTERIGLAASIACLNKMKAKDVPKHLIAIGEEISTGWKRLADNHGISMEIVGIPPLTTFKFRYANSQAIHTLFTQEMLKRGYLASKSVYVSHCHTRECIRNYLENVDEVFGLIRGALDNNNIELKLEGPIAHEGFKRLT